MSDHKRALRDLDELASGPIGTERTIAATILALVAERDEARRRADWLFKDCEKKHAEIKAAEADRDAAIKTLEMISDAEYRGNRSGESVAAHLFLVSIGRRQ